ncbi:MAG: hypothetical protein GY815_04200 [Gammaproteobacteria bacterium]|nr:hypothetical protein [Gammaproteobacteria bacterium]
MTKETEVTIPAAPVMASRDREEEDPKLVEVIEDVTIVDDNPVNAAESDDVRGDIYKRHAKKRDAEIAEQIDPDSVETPTAGEENAQIAVENYDSATIIEPGQQASTPPDEDDPLVEVVIFEQVRQVPQSKIDKAGGIQMYQMREAAYEQMRRNAAAAEELAAREQALDERERSAPQLPAVPSDQQAGQPPTDLPSDDQTLETMAQQAVEAVYDGRDDAPSTLVKTVESVVQRVLDTSPNSNINENDLRKSVTEDVLRDQRKTKVVQARQILFDKTPQLDKRRPDSFDHRLFQAVDDETDVVERQHPEWEPEKVINEAWGRVKKWHGSHQTETMTDKHKEKQELNRPKAATGRFTPPGPPPRKTNSDYVRDQRIARGLEPE